MTIDDDGRAVDGIVFELASPSKIVVAIVDKRRGPVFRTVSADALSPRSAEDAADKALRLLIRRTPHAGQGHGRAGAGGVAGRSGHGRAAMHRTTGK